MNTTMKALFLSFVIFILSAVLLFIIIFMPEIVHFILNRIAG